jgi:hypothetical protein
MRLLNIQVESFREEGAADLAIKQREEQEAGKECRMRSSEIFTPCHILLGRKNQGRFF